MAKTTNKKCKIVQAPPDHPIYSQGWTVGSASGDLENGFTVGKEIPAPNTLIKVAFGEQGDRVHWEESFREIEHALTLLWGLEELGAHHAVDWKSLLKDLKRFKEVPDVEFPPFYEFRDLDCIEGLSTMIDEPDGEYGPGMSFNQIQIYIVADEKDQIIHDFGILSKRLVKYFEQENQAELSSSPERGGTDRSTETLEIGELDPDEVDDLIYQFNGDVGHSGWVAARGRFLHRLREGFEATGLDCSDFICDGGMSCKYPVKRVGDKIVQIKTRVD